MAFNESQVILGDQKKLEVSTDGGTTYAQIFGTKEIKFPEAERGKADYTNDSSPDQHKEYLPSWYEPGTSSFSYVYTYATYSQVEALLYATTKPKFRYTLKDGMSKTFSGFVTKNPLPTDIEGVPMCEAEVQVSGKAAMSSSSSSSSSS